MKRKKDFLAWTSICKCVTHSGVDTVRNLIVTEPDAMLEYIVAVLPDHMLRASLEGFN